MARIKGSPLSGISFVGANGETEWVQGMASVDPTTGLAAPLPVGGTVASTPPTYTSGQEAEMRLFTGGGVAVVLTRADGTEFVSSTTASDSQTGTGLNLQVRNLNYVYNGTSFDRMRGDITGSWSHNPPSAASSALSGTITTSGTTAAITMTNVTRTEIINPSASTLWASWGTPAVGGAGSFPILTNGTYNVPDRAAGTLTLLSTAASQPYTINRFT